MLERKQFTFYRSFFEAIETIPGKHHRADMYRMVCDYALNGRLPELEGLTNIQRANMRIIMPILDSARQKAEAGQMGGSKPKADRKQNESKNKTKTNTKTNTNTKDKIKDTASVSPEATPFDIFWNVYPRKVGKDKARLAFYRVTVPLEKLLQALEEQKCSYQWIQDDGAFIPNAETWLEQRRWEDELPMLSGAGIKASGVMGETEREAVRRMLAEG